MTSPPDQRRQPESVRLLILLWAGALGGELIHQILNMVMSFLDPSAFFAAAREAGENEALVSASVYASIIVVGLLSLLIVGVLALMLRLVHRRSKYAPMARRMLLFFGFYFGFRTLLLFTASPGASDVPVAMYLIDGSLQILVGVAAVLAVIFGMRQDCLKWTGELADAEQGGR